MQIGVIIVTFNRKRLLINCLDAILAQSYPVKCIYIIDNNSTDGTHDLLYEKGFLGAYKKNRAHGGKALFLSHLEDRGIFNISSASLADIRNYQGENTTIFYVRTNKNVGGAGGFKYGIQLAVEDKEADIDGLWLMDDDVMPDADCLQRLVSLFSHNVSIDKTGPNPPIIGIAPKVVSFNGRLQKEHRGWIRKTGFFPSLQYPVPPSYYREGRPIEIDYTSFVGPLLLKDTVKKVGPPLERLFIFHDDVEYSLRLKKVGRLILSTDAVIRHKGQKDASLLLPYKKAWRLYFAKRNLIWVASHAIKKRPLFYKDLLISLMAYSILIILRGSHKKKRLLLLYRAYYDGLKGIFNNNTPFKMLYD